MTNLGNEFDPAKAHDNQEVRIEEARKKTTEVLARRARKASRIGNALAKKVVVLANDGHLNEEMIAQTRPLMGHRGFINRHP